MTKLSNGSSSQSSHRKIPSRKFSDSSASDISTWDVQARREEVTDGNDAELSSWDRPVARKEARLKDLQKRSKAKTGSEAAQ